MAEIHENDSASDAPTVEFELLAMRYLDGLSTVEEAQELENQLSASAEKRNQLAAFCVQIGMLGEIAMSEDARAADPDQALLAPRNKSSLAMPILFPNHADVGGENARSAWSFFYVLSAFVRALRDSPQRLIVSPWRVAGFCLALALLIAGVVWQIPGDATQLTAQRESQLIASLKNGTQAKWRDGQPVPDGAQFSEGQVLELAGGQAQISISCGAEVIMRAPCTIELAAPNQLVLREGLLCVQLADWTNEFTVATDTVQILDLGKQFIVSADSKSGAVEAHAIDGKLRVQSKNSTADNHYGMLVTEGEAIRIQPASNTPMRLKANDHLFGTALDDSLPYKPIEIHNTGRRLTPGDEDPNWRIVNSSADDFGGARYAVACRQYTNIYLPNEPDVSQWISVTHPVDDNCPPNTMYTFETEFDLSDYDLSTVTIVAHVLADNGVMGVRINGEHVAFKPWSAVYGLFDTYHKIDITHGFVQGVNRIQFDVWNSIVMTYPDNHNPMALRVEWQAFGRLKRREVAQNVFDSDVDSPAMRRVSDTGFVWHRRRLEALIQNRAELSF